MQRKFLQTVKFIFCLNIFASIFFVSSAEIQAQKVVDKTVATVGDNVVKAELITYSDLLWQLALQPDAPLNPPTSVDLNRALQVVIDQRLIALEAQRLPSLAPTDAQVREKIKDVLDVFPSTAEFERRLRLVGFDSVNDDNFQRIMRQRVAIEKYLDFRFRSFVVITPEDEARYYREIYVPDFRKRNPGVLVPAFDETRVRINQVLMERKIAEDIEKFLDDAKRRADIEVLFEV
jgi:parvulin-like peptidyl-prolyl isomerase